MARGRIIKLLAGYYYVLDENGTVWQCRARGVFKKRGLQPVVGDHVSFDLTGEGEGWITDVAQRKNQLIRPSIANVDQALLVFSIREPPFQYHLLDRLLVSVEKERIDPLICITKLDLAREDDEITHLFNCYRRLGYPVYGTSKTEMNGLKELTSLLAGKITVLAGPSGVGKSTLINRLCPEAKLETGRVSSKLGRGRHTTRRVELLILPGGGLVADTPGFSQIDLAEIPPEELGYYFVEIGARAESCKYRGCLHHNEPDCAVKEAVERGEIDLRRYTHYLQFLQEIVESEQRKRF